MDFEGFEEYMLQMAARHEQRMAQLDEKQAEITRIQVGLAIGHAKSQADLAAWASRCDNQRAESEAKFERELATPRAHSDAGMEGLRKEARIVGKAIHEQTITLNRPMDRQTRHEQDPGAHGNLPRPA